MNISNQSYQYLKQSNHVRITLSCWKSHFMLEFFNEDYVSSDFLLGYFSLGFRYGRSFYFARRHQLMEHQFGERSKKHRPELTAATILLIRSNGRGRNISFFLLILWNRTWESMMLRGARSRARVGVTETSVDELLFMSGEQRFWHLKRQRLKNLCRLEEAKSVPSNSK